MNKIFIIKFYVMNFIFDSFVEISGLVRRIQNYGNRYPVFCRSEDTFRYQYTFIDNGFISFAYKYFSTIKANNWVVELASPYGVDKLIKITDSRGYFFYKDFKDFKNQYLEYRN